MTQPCLIRAIKESRSGQTSKNYLKCNATPGQHSYSHSPQPNFSFGPSPHLPLPARGAPARRRGGALPFVVSPSFPGHRAALRWGYADEELGGGAVAAASAAAGEGQLEAGAR